MNKQWLKELTNEELVEKLDLGLQRLNKTEVFTTAHKDLYADVKLIKEEIINRLNK